MSVKVAIVTIAEIFDNPTRSLRVKDYIEVENNVPEEEQDD